MEKLIKLLNEYENTDNWENGHQVEFRENKIISKKFGFIQRLVENDKIDLEKLLKAIKENKIYCGKRGKTRNMLLMLLSIQDDPINFLIDILK